MSYIKSYCKIVPGRVTLNGEVFFESDFVRNDDLNANRDVDMRAVLNADNANFNVDDKLRSAHEFFSAVYGCLGVDYRKFYKMDALSKLGFVASEILMEGIDKVAPKEDMGIVLFNRSSSLETDCRYQRTIQNEDDFFPSPAEFVYTLPNIVTGEIAIRNKITGETAFYVVSDFQGDKLCEAIDDMMNLAGMKRVLAGWTEVDAFTGEISGFMVLCEAQGEVQSEAKGKAHGNTLYDKCAGNVASAKQLNISLTGDILEELYSKY